MIASEEAGFSNTMDVGRFVRTRAVCDVRGRSIASCCKDLPNLDSGVTRNVLGTTTFWTSSSQRIKVYSAWTLKYRHQCAQYCMDKNKLHRLNLLHETWKGWMSPTPSPKGRVCVSGDRLLSSHHQCSGVKFLIGERRWYAISFFQKKFARAKECLQTVHESSPTRAGFPRR